MSKHSGLSVLAVLVVGFSAHSSPAATVLISNNPNVHSGGLNMVPPGSDWIPFSVFGGQVPGVTPGLTQELDNDRGGPDGGDWIVRTSDGSGASQPHNLGYFSDWFAPPNGAGLYNVDLSGWTKSVASWWSGENFNWVQEAHIELWIDGGMVWSAMTSNNTVRNTWVLHSHSDLHQINTEIGVVLRSVKGNDAFGTGNLGAIFAASRWDDIHLSVAFIPEPSSALLSLCAVGLLGVCRRRSR